MSIGIVYFVCIFTANHENSIDNIGLDFSNLSVKFGDATIAYGLFIQTIIDFLIISMCIFIMVKIFEKFKTKEEEKPKEKSDDIKLLEEIRDLLKEKAK